MHFSFFCRAGFLALMAFSPFTLAQSSPPPIRDPGLIPAADIDNCLRTNVSSAAAEMTMAELRTACWLLLQQEQSASAPASESSNPEIETETVKTVDETHRLLGQRMTIEALNRSNRFVLTPHKRNYVLPVTYKDHPYRQPYLDANASFADLDYAEAEFQFSVKILLREGLLGDNGHLYLGYTNHSLWQVYNRENSAPFRETNHQPELILSFTNDWEILGFHNVLNELILNHQSNGQSGLLSRSWNRIMLNSVFERGNLAFSFTPWYRLPEDKQKYPGDPRGDDNPDIEKYLGHFEFNGAWQHKKEIFSFTLRNNLRSHNKGALELGWTFPFSHRLPKVRGYVKYLNGYGHSLIDYNDSAQLIGLGIAFTDLF
jgi:phospholipase A1